MSIHFIKMIKDYKLSWLSSDFTAGLTVAAIALPQNMAYALIAGVSPVYGLYTSIVSMLVATFVGNSNYMVVGPTNVMAVAIASSLHFLNGSNYLMGMFLLTFMVGVIQILLGFLKLGNLVNYISHSVVVGIITGVAVIIGVGQINNFFGFSIDGGINVFVTLYRVANNLHQTNHYSLAFGIITIIIILVIKNCKLKVLPYLSAVIISTFLVYIFNLEGNLKLVGKFSSSLFNFQMVKFEMGLIKQLFSSALSIAVLSFIQVISIVKFLDKKFNQNIDLNKEFMGLGITNVVCSHFNSFAISGSFTNSFANFEAGARTRISELVTALTIFLFLLVFSPIVRYIPISSLAAIVILVAVSMFDKDEIFKSFQTTPFDAAIFLSTFITTILSPRLDYAVYFGIIVSLFIVLRNTSQIDYTHISYNDEESENDFTRKKYDDVKNDKFIVINLAGTIHFNASENLKKKLNDSFVRDKVFVIRMREINNIDITAIQEFEKFIDRVNQYEGEVIISGVSEDIYNYLEKYGIVDKLEEENIFQRCDDFFSSTKDAIEKAEDHVSD